MASKSEEPCQAEIGGMDRAQRTMKAWGGGPALLVSVKQPGVCRELPVGVCARWERVARAGGWGSGPREPPTARLQVIKFLWIETGLQLGECLWWAAGELSVLDCRCKRA